MHIISLIAFTVFLLARSSAWSSQADRFPLTVPSSLASAERNEVQVDSLMQYFRYVNLAGRQIYRNDFLKASLSYDSAFLYKKQPFYVDLKNHILVNSKCGRFDRNTRSILLLMKDKQIDSAFLFAELPVRVFSPENLQQIYKLQKQYHAAKKKFTPYQQAIHDMFVFERAARDLSLYEPDNPEKPGSKDLENAKRFVKLYKESGFPSEEKTGVVYKNNMLWSEAVHLLLWSFIRTKEKETIMDILKKECKAGRLHPALYASLCSIYNENTNARVPDYDFMSTTVVLLKKEAYRPLVIYSDSLMQLVNTNRISIGLDSFHTTQKQVICQRFYKLPVGTQIIPMTHYSNMDAMPYGLVKAAFDKENMEMNDYKINVERILSEGKCQEKCY